MNARALRFLEIESRGKGTNANIISQTPKFLHSQYTDGIDLDLMQMLLGKLNDFDTMITISQKSQHPASLTRKLTEEAGKRELYGDVEGSCQAYEQLLDSRLGADIDGNDVRQGLLRCQLKLGRLDSVINQAYGMSTSNEANKKLRISDEFIPSAAEAAWRLGNWSVLDQITVVDIESIPDSNGRHQLCLSRVIHSLHEQSSSKFISSIQQARESVMTSLSSAARDSYSQSYPHLMQLHALQEIEHSSRNFFETSPSNDTHEALSNEWQHRLNFLSPDSTGSNVIVNTRLALCRMAKEPISEGQLWLDIGKKARKGGLFKVAEQCLTHADVAFCNLNNSRDDHKEKMAQESIGKVKLQFSKLKYALGETTTALNLIDDVVPSSIFHLDSEELQSFVSRSNQSVDIIGRFLLQATEWMVLDGLKSGSEIRSRYQTVLKLVPNWERGT
jgi:hypothetical protein